MYQYTSLLQDARCKIHLTAPERCSKGSSYWPNTKYVDDRCCLRLKTWARHRVWRHSTNTGCRVNSIGCTAPRTRCKWLTMDWLTVSMAYHTAVLLLLYSSMTVPFILGKHHGVGISDCIGEHQPEILLPKIHGAPVSQRLSLFRRRYLAMGLPNIELGPKQWAQMSAFYFSKLTMRMRGPPILYNSCTETSSLVHNANNQQISR